MTFNKETDDDDDDDDDDELVKSIKCNFLIGLLCYSALIVTN